MSATDKRRKLTDEQREEIRRRYPAEMQKDLAAEYGVSQTTISFVVNPISEQTKRKSTNAWIKGRYGVDLEWTERRREGARRWRARRHAARSQQAAE